MIDGLRRLVHRQQFSPGLLGLFFNPFYLARAGLREGMEELSANLKGRLLDVGCGTQPYRELFKVEEYFGLDIDNESTRKKGVADVFYDGITFPFENDSFDSVLCNQVLEHVFNPDEFLSEIGRVLKPGGMLLLTVPFVWDEHEQPHDYARYSSFGLKALIEKQGFRILRQQKIRDDVSVIFQLLNAYLFKVVYKAQPWLRMILCVSVMAQVTLMGLILGKLLPSNPDLYLDQIVLGEKK